MWYWKEAKLKDPGSCEDNLGARLVPSEVKACESAHNYTAPAIYIRKDECQQLLVVAYKHKIDWAYMEQPSHKSTRSKNLIPLLYSYTRGAGILFGEKGASSLSLDDSCMN